LASFSFNGKIVKEDLPFGKSKSYPLDKKSKLINALRLFSAQFEENSLNLKFITNGLFGYMQYDTVTHFEDIKLKSTGESKIPMMHYAVYQNVIVVDHFKNEMHLLEHQFEGDEKQENLSQLESILHNKNIPSYSFELVGEETSNYTDEAFLEILKKRSRTLFQR
jgi:Anthranilate/para-aminobenzoate synthases component I